MSSLCRLSLCRASYGCSGTQTGKSARMGKRVLTLSSIRCVVLCNKTRFPAPKPPCNLSPERRDNCRYRSYDQLRIVSRVIYELFLPSSLRWSKWSVSSEASQSETHQTLECYQWLENGEYICNRPHPTLRPYSLAVPRVNFSPLGSNLCYDPKR